MDHDERDLSGTRPRIVIVDDPKAIRHATVAENLACGGYAAQPARSYRVGEICSDSVLTHTQARRLAKRQLFFELSEGDRKEFDRFASIAEVKLDYDLEIVEIPDQPSVGYVARRIKCDLHLAKEGNRKSRRKKRKAEGKGRKRGK